MIVLHTPRLFLRNFIPEDLEVLYDYRNNEGCARYQHWENTSKEYLRESDRALCAVGLPLQRAGTALRHLQATGAADGQLIGDLSYFYNGGRPLHHIGVHHLLPALAAGVCL